MESINVFNVFFSLIAAFAIGFFIGQANPSSKQKKEKKLCSKDGCKEFRVEDSKYCSDHWWYESHK